MANTDVSFTKYGWSSCLWILVIAFQYGYHISALNQIQAVLTCKITNPNLFLPLEYAPTTCIPMSDFIFSFVTAIFTVGGLAGSLVANLIMDRWGRKGASKICAVLMAGGSGLFGISGSVISLLLGRFLVGVGSGIGLCVGPIFLAEIAPAQISGSVGVLTQLGIVLGIMVTQMVGIRFATPTGWRLVFLLSCLLSLLQIMTSPLMVESPVWLLKKRNFDDYNKVASKLWGRKPPVELEESLLEEAQQSDDNHIPNVDVPQLFAFRELRRPLIIVSLAMLSQQVSGINAVLYYSNDILAKSLPEFGPYVSLGITVVNVLMTFPPIILIEKMGRKPLLTISTLGALASLTCIGFGLNMGSVSLSSVAILTFVMSFAIGLGPIPFVMIPDVSPAHAVSAISSVALSLNWIANFIVGLVFLPLRNFLAGGDMLKEGRIFYVFVILLFSSTFMLSRMYRG